MPLSLALWALLGLVGCTVAAHATAPCTYRAQQQLPSATCTTGAVYKAASAYDVCQPGWAAAHRHVTYTTRHRAFARYGVPYALHSSYELDHLIPLELGGNNTLQNLWPEPLTAARRKDVTENALHRAVCVGALPLRTAQQRIARDWRTALRRTTQRTDPPQEWSSATYYTGVKHCSDFGYLWEYRIAERNPPTGWYQSTLFSVSLTRHDDDPLHGIGYGYLGNQYVAAVLVGSSSTQAMDGLRFNYVQPQVGDSGLYPPQYGNVAYIAFCYIPPPTSVHKPRPGMPWAP